MNVENLLRRITRKRAREPFFSPCALRCVLCVLFLTTAEHGRTENIMEG